MTPFEHHPVVRIVVDILVHGMFPSIVFGVSARMGLKPFLRQLSNAGVAGRTFLVANVAVPLFCLALVLLFPIPKTIAGLLVLLAISPGDSFVMLETRDKRGSMELSAFLLTVLSLTLPLTVPVWIWILSRWAGVPYSGDPIDICKFVLPLTLAPLLAGIVMGEYARGLALKLAVICDWFARISMILVGIGALILGVEGLRSFNVMTVVAIAALVSFSLAAGYFSGGRDPKEKVSIALTTSLGNLAVVLLIAKHNTPGLRIGAPAVAITLIRWVVIMAWYLAFRRRLGLAKE